MSLHCVWATGYTPNNPFTNSIYILILNTNCTDGMRLYFCLAMFQEPQRKNGTFWSLWLNISQYFPHFLFGVHTHPRWFTTTLPTPPGWTVKLPRCPKCRRLEPPGGISRLDFGWSRKHTWNYLFIICCCCCCCCCLLYVVVVVVYYMLLLLFIICCCCLSYVVVVYYMLLLFIICCCCLLYVVVVVVYYMLLLLLLLEFFFFLIFCCICMSCPKRFGMRGV